MKARAHISGGNSSRPRRIAHILPWPSVGGTEQATARFASAVEGDEFTSVAFCLPNADPVRALFESAGIPVLQYEAVEPSYRHPRDYLRTSRALAAQLRDAKIDLVHFADVFAAHRGTLATFLAGVPAITHVRGSFPETPSWRDRSFLLPLRHFVFVSEDARRAFGHGPKRAKGVVLYDGLKRKDHDPAARREVRAELGIAVDAPVIGMVARLAPEKDFPTLVLAAAKVVASHPSVRFLMVGQHSGVDTYVEHFRLIRGLIDDHGLGAQFIFTDHRSDVDRLIAAMDVCVLSTHKEGLPLVVLEAMAQSKPFVGTDVGGISEIVRHGTTGLLVPHGDADALARELNAVLDDPSLAARLALGGARLVETEFSLTSFQARGRALYRSVFGSRR